MMHVGYCYDCRAYISAAEGMSLCTNPSHQTVYLFTYVQGQGTWRYNPSNQQYEEFDPGPMPYQVPPQQLPQTPPAPVFTFDDPQTYAPHQQADTTPTQPLVPQPTPFVPAAAEVVQHAVQAMEEYPVSSDGVELCQSAWNEYGIKTHSQRRVALVTIQGIRATSPEDALKLLRQWNTAYPDHQISTADAGFRPTDFAPRQQGPTGPPQSDTLLYGGRQHPLDLFAANGSYNAIYRPSGSERLVPNRPNDQVLVRKPLPGGTAIRDGLQFCGVCQSLGIATPYIHNFGTCEQDGVYIVERVPNEFDATNPRHVAQVAAALGAICQAPEVPDYRPDNVRFRDDGTAVLIDFTEPGVDRQQSRNDHAATMRSFVDQFVQTAPPHARNALRTQLMAQIPREFQREMEAAVDSFLQ
jgi:hypothetical protein